jgi:hypothetical protein
MAHTLDVHSLNSGFPLVFMVLFNTFNPLLIYHVKILQTLLPRGLIVTTNLRGKGFDVGAI